MATAPQASALAAEAEVALVDAHRRRRTLRPPTRELTVGIALAGGFSAVALALAFLPARHPADLWPALILTCGYAFLFRTRWEAGTGWALPTQLMLVPMLLLLPPRLVPLCVGCGLLIGQLLSARPTQARLERLPLVLASGWHAVAPALVLWAAGAPELAWRHWPVYVAALVAQLATDFAVSAAHDRLAYGVSIRSRVRFALPVYVVDVSLAPVGLLVAFAARETPAAAVLVLPIAVLFRTIAHERRAHVDSALELSNAYKGTAFLLGDVVEADDAYTGSHSRHVVELVLAVSDELGLDARGRRDAEFVALLHDVGKIRVPSEIINKPGALDDAEWAVMKHHTIEGERMLAGVGGLLAQVGNVVRSCHERWDGGGYPDGLAGDEIPLIARIVMACDAYSAMTTDRAYRGAMSKPEAIAELLVNAGTQFDPLVVQTLVRLETR